MHFLPITLLLSILWTSLGFGTITGYGVNPIENTVANEGLTADYTFAFVPEITVPAGGLVVIAFPSQYPTDLGFTSTPNCSITCSASGNNVTFTLPVEIPAETNYSVIVQGVLNPNSSGGTGNFQVMTYEGINILNQNLVFGVIGIAGSIGKLQSTVVSLSSNGVSTAGSYTHYNFQFETATECPTGAYFLITILDTSFQIPPIPRCQPYSINGIIVLGDFYCNTVGQNIYIYGLQEYLPANSLVGFTISLGNPTVVKTTNTFTIASFRPNTTVMYDQRTGITGVTITAGVVSNISLTQVNSNAIAAQGKDMDYILKFTFTNQLYALTVVTIDFPPTFVIDTSTTQNVYIMYGLEDISESNPVGLSISSNIITLSNYYPYSKPREIAIYVRAINPSNEGTTSPLQIQSWTNYLLINIMDQDITSAYTTITGNPSPTANSVTATYYTAGGVATDLTFSFTPTLEVPTNGLIIINVPLAMGWSAIIGVSNILITPNGGSSFNPATLAVSGNQLTLTIPSPPTGAALPISLSHKIAITGVFLTPSVNGTYIFDMTTMTDPSNVLESWSSILIITSAPFPTLPYPLAISNFYSTINSYSILDVSFTAGNNIPVGSPQNLASDLRGFVQFTFTGVSNNLGWSSLNSGDSIPCKSIQGIVAVSGGTLNCTIIFGSSTTNPMIILKNFQAVAAGTYVEVRFPNFLNPSAAGAITVQISAYSKQNRIWTLLNTGSVSYNVAGTSSPTVTTIPTTPTSSSSQYTFNSLATPQVSSTVTFSFNAHLSTGIAASSIVLIQLPSGWIPSATVASNVVCKVSGVTIPCIAYEDVNWVSMQLSSTQSFATTDTNWVISNLQVPFMSTTTPGNMILTVISGGTAVQQYVHNTFPVYATPAFSDASLVVALQGHGYVDVQYTISLRIPNAIPAGSSIEIDFPSSYNLLGSSPAVTFGSPSFQPISSTQPVTFTPTLYKLYITNFATYPANTALSIDVYGVKNPSSGTYSAGWNVFITYTDSTGMTGTIASQTNFDQFTFGASFTSGTINFESITSTPMNADQYATTVIAFTPQTAIAAGGLIEITFPSQYKSLPSPPECYLSGGITTFTSCIFSGSTVTITTNTDYLYGGVNVTIMNVLNPDFGTTDGFVITTSYDGVTLDVTDTTSLVGRTLSTTPKPNAITYLGLSFNPQNEGETSDYNFTFLPLDEIDTTMEIMLGFPYQFDQLLGDTITCAATNGLLGTISCTVLNRWVTVTGFTDYLPTKQNPVTIMVYGVTNPNSNSINSGQFQVATLVAGTSSFVDYNSAFGALQSTVAPGWATLYSVAPVNLYARLTSDYNFNFTTSATIPKTSSSGAIYVDLPSQFQVADGTLQCSTATTDFTTELDCTVLRERIIINGQTSDYTGNVVFTVRSLTNPIYDGQSDIIYVKTYDGVNLRVIQRSYKNLDPFSFYYVYPGPLVTVNNNEDIYVNRGTASVLIPITVDYPCALNLTFKPVAAKFPIIPFLSPMNLGMVQVNFQVSVPEATYTGNYSLEWETLGDIIPAFYTPIKTSYVIVTASTGIVVNVPSIPDVPYGGNSLPIILTVSEPPDIQIYVTVNFQTSYAGLSLSNNVATFYGGNTSASFIIYSSNNVNVTGGVIVTGGEIILQLSGVNSDLYTLSSTSVTFNVVGSDNFDPVVKSVTFSNITQTTAAATIVVSELSMMYYMVALQGTLAPPLSEMLTLGPANYTSTRSSYFAVETPTNLTINISLTNLEASLDWGLYIYLVDQGNNTNTPPTIANFTCLSRYQSASVSLRFIQVALSEAQIQNILLNVAFVLSLYPWKIQEQVYFLNRRLLDENPYQITYSPENEGSETEADNSTLTNDLADTFCPSCRNLQSTSVYSLLFIQLVAIPNNEYYPSPLLVAQSLENKTDQLYARLPNYDTTYPINAYEFISYIPKFVETPTLFAVGETWAAFTTELNNVGFVFAVAIQTNASQGAPSPYQIWQGYDYNNIPQPNASAEVSQYYTHVFFNISGLIPLTEYVAYIVGGSVQPGYPDLMDPSQVVGVTFTTEPSAIIAPLDINHATLLKIPFTILVILIFTALFI